jgi:hypothetical protein
MVVPLQSVFERSGQPFAGRKRVEMSEPLAGVGVTHSEYEKAEA